MKKRFLFVVFCALGVLVSFAQNRELSAEAGVGMEISGFRVPDYDKEGNLRAQLYGGHAKILSDGEVEISYLKIDLYKEGQVAMTLFAPHCFFDTKTHQARSDGRVLLDSDSTTITGRGFIWSPQSGHFEIFHQAKVLVKDAKKSDLKELGL